LGRIIGENKSSPAYSCTIQFFMYSENIVEKPKCYPKKFETYDATNIHSDNPLVFDLLVGLSLG